MLVLTRKSGQKLIINDNIEVIILETRGDTVKIGIKAPKDVTIYREEIYEEIKKSNVESGKQVKPQDLDLAMKFLQNKPGQNKYSDKLQNILNKPKQQ